MIIEYKEDSISCDFIFALRVEIFVIFARLSSRI